MNRSTRQNDKSFFWTLFSDSDTSNYPHNIPSDFINKFPLPNGSIDRENYEIGLVDIKYLPINFQNIPRENLTPESSQPVPKRPRTTQVVPQPEEDGPFFPNLQATEPDVIEFQKTTTEIEVFFNSLTQSLLPKHVTILRENYLRENTAFATVKFDPPDTNQILVLPDEIINILGFKQNFFLPGTTSAYGKVDYSEFEKIPMNDELLIVIHTLNPSYKNNLIKVTTAVEYIEKFTIDFEKGHENPIDLMNEIQSRFTQNRFMPFTIAFSADLDERKLHSTSVLDFTGRNPNEQLVLPEMLARGLGFNTNKFTPGHYESPNEANSDLFSGFVNGSEIDFKFTIPFTFEIPMNEPSERSLQQVVQEITEAMTIYGLSIIFVKDEDLVEPRLRPFDTVQLPPKINKYLNLAENYVINAGGNKINTSKAQVPNPEPEEEAFVSSSELTVSETTNIIQVNVKPKLMLITCDAVSNQYFGNKQYPLLRVLDLSDDYIKPSQVSFSPILYLPTQTNDISQLRIRCLDENGNLLNLGTNQVRVTLHFKVLD